MNQPSAGWRLLVHDQVTSTADLVRSLAERGEGDRCAVLAFRQIAGRGTRGRSWASPAGNLYLSVLLRPSMEAREVPGWGLLAAVALHSALAPHAGPGLTLKWPNDMLLGGAKCAGILSEASLTASGRLEWLAFGFGVNLAHAPALPDRPTAAFPPPRIEPEAAARAVMAALDNWRAVWEREGFGPILSAWAERGHQPGTRLTVSGPHGPLTGTFAGLDASGGLRLLTANGMETITTGEVRP